MIETEQWPPNNNNGINNFSGATHEAILKPSRETQTVCESKAALEKIWENFPLVQLIKLSRVLQIVSEEYMNGD